MYILLGNKLSNCNMKSGFNTKS